jgi:3-methyladenine DNA glycosylase AlkD
MPPRDNCNEVLGRLRSLGDPKAVAGMARYGITVTNAWGVSAPKIRQLAKELGRDHALALQLWRSGVLDARGLASLVDDPAKVTIRQMESWAKDFDSWAVCDAACGCLFDKTPYAWAKAVEWSARREEYVKRAGFVLMAALAVHDKKTPDDRFEPFLPLIARHATDERNFVKKAVNWALRNIGKRNRALNRAAIACAEKLLAAANRRAGGERGGDAGARAARWIATDALRELSSAKAQARLGK